MKLFDITHFYTTKSGGIKTYLLKKSEYISKNIINDIEHFLILPSNESAIETKWKSQFYFIESPETPFWKPYRFIINKSRVRDIIFNEKPDIVEIGSPYLLPSWIKGFQKELGYKVIGFYHSHIEVTLLSALNIKTEREYHKSLIRHYIKSTYGDMDLVLTPSIYMAKYLNEIGIQSTQAIHLGVDLNIFTMDKKDLSFRKRLNLCEDKIILLFVGRFSKEKQIHRLIDVLKILNYQYSNKYHLILVGGGPEEEKIKNMNLNDVTILPYCHDKEELAKIYNSSDIFITASDSETFGLCLLEAQSCGLPVVALEHTSIPEVVYRKEFLAKDTQDFADKIQIVSNILCEKFRREIRDFSVNNFSWDKTFEKLFYIYQELRRSHKNLIGKSRQFHIKPSHINKPLWIENPLTLRIDNQE